MKATVDDLRKCREVLFQILTSETQGLGDAGIEAIMEARRQISILLSRRRKCHTLKKPEGTDQDHHEGGEV